ncbi:MAG TPA: DUF1501 domain-containing protein [Planctomycetota bacterium]|nr:DUF1501 domain-containing protein [Planctomycetota bacterium]
MNWTRRDLLKAGGLSLLGLGVDSFVPAFLRRRLLAAPQELAQKKMVFIFQRGGNDGINTVIPYGDPEYNVSTRPTLYIPENLGLDLGNGFAGLHPRLEPLLEIYNHSSLNGVDGPGNLAVIHPVGYSGQSQSHFDSQQYWENGMPGNDSDEGMLYRQVAAMTDFRSNRFPAASISSSQMVALKGPLPIPTLRTASSFRFDVPVARSDKFLGALPPSSGSAGGRGLLGAYGGPRDFPGKPYRDLVYGTGLALADAMNVVRAALEQGPYTPQNGAEYPSGSFGEKLLEAAMLLKRTPVRIVGVNIGGWDLHTRQGAANGSHGSLLEDLAEGYRALYLDLQDQWEDLLIVNMTEFGRTSKENGSQGTDHADATCMLIAGGGVRGGVYNCDDTTWAAGDIFSRRGRYLERRTDFRAVFAEIFVKHFGDDPSILEEVIPGYTAAKNANPSDFVPLDFLV